MRRLIFFVLSVVAIVVVIFLVSQTVMDRSGGATVEIGQVVVAVEIAATPEARERGLSGRDALAPNRGLLFVFPNAAEQVFWMKDMLIPIDIIWLQENKVVGVVEHALPPAQTDGYVQQFVSPQPVDRVLEVAAGFVRRENVKFGDAVEVRYNK